MPRYDFKCPRCGRRREETFRSFEQQEQTSVICNCGNAPGSVFTVMERQPAAPSFIVKGFRAANGYSK